MDYELIILFALVEIAMDEGASEHLKKLRISALNKVQHRLNAYHHLGYIRQLTTAIAEKKCSMIQKATSQAEINRILDTRCPRYDGNKFVEDPYILPEEELIGWSCVSLQAPLNAVGAARFQELFHRIFPNGVTEATHNA